MPEACGTLVEKHWSRYLTASSNKPQRTNNLYNSSCLTTDIVWHRSKLLLGDISASSQETSDKTPVRIAHVLAEI
jgi:hypothetical protein